MYYILNGTNQVIAADNELLALCGVSHINDLYSNIILQKIAFNLTQSNLTLSTPNKEYHFLVSKTSLSTMLGHLILVTIKQEESSKDNSVTTLKKSINTDVPSLNILDSINKPQIKPINIFEKNEEEKPQALQKPMIEETDDLISQLTFEEDEELEPFDMNLDLDEVDTIPNETIIVEKSKKIEEEIPTFDDDLDLDELFALDAQNTEEPIIEKVEEEIIVETPTPSIETEDEEDLDLDELFALDAENTKEIEEKVEPEQEITSNIEDELDLDMDDLFALDDENTKEVEEPEEEVAEIENDLDMDELFALDVESTKEVEEPEEEVAEIENDLDMDELFALDVESTKEVAEPEEEVVQIENDLDMDELFALDVESTKEGEKEEEDTSEILVNITQLSQDIGISTEDYNAFLDEYIDAAIGLEEDLRGTDSKKHANAIGTLSHLCDVLRLPYVGDIISKIDKVPQNQREDAVDTFYATLSRITTYEASEAPATPQEELPEREPPKEEIAPLVIEAVQKPIVEPIIEPAVAPVIEPIIEEVIAPPIAPVNENSFGILSLEGIKPKHFDFQLEEAANDLSLPVELIEEFVIDFIEQAREETTNMLEAYQKGDLDAIQKIGHLLKGTSSNLRIKPLADTLYKIQFCEDSSQLEYFIKDYWAHFLSFEIQINTISR